MCAPRSIFCLACVDNYALDINKMYLNKARVISAKLLELKCEEQTGRSGKNKMKREETDKLEERNTET